MHSLWVATEPARQLNQRWAIRWSRLATGEQDALNDIEMKELLRRVREWDTHGPEAAGLIEAEFERLRQEVTLTRLHDKRQRDELARLLRIEEAARDFHDAWGAVESAIVDFADAKEVRAGKVRLEAAEQVLYDVLEQA